MTGYERITWLYKRIKAKRYPCRVDFTAYFEVSKSTFKRDIAFLRDRLGAPIAYHQDRGGYYFSDQTFELPSFWFDHRQLLLIAAICSQLELFFHSEAMTILRRRLSDMLTFESGNRAWGFASRDIDWDIRKALNLFQKTNPSLIEWLYSPMICVERAGFREKLPRLLPQYYFLRSCFYHYLHMAQGNYREYLRGDAHNPSACPQILVYLTGIEE